MFLKDQKVRYQLKPRHIGIIHSIHPVRGTDRIDYRIRYADEHLLVQAEGHLLEVAR